jgi:hypothetical protein
MVAVTVKAQYRPIGGMSIFHLFNSDGGNWLSAHTGLTSRKLKIPPGPINSQFISAQQPSALSESDQSHLCTMHNFLLMFSHEEDFIDKHYGHRVEIFTLSPLLPDGEQNRLLQHVGNNPSEKNPEVPWERE